MRVSMGDGLQYRIERKVCLSLCTFLSLRRRWMWSDTKTA